MGRGRKTSLVIHLTPEEQRILESWQRSTSIRAGLAKRGRIILLLAHGASVSHISRVVDIRRRFVYKWARRFMEQRIVGLTDKPGRGRPRAADRPKECACQHASGEKEEQAVR